VIVFCDTRHLPYSVILPLTEGNSLHAKILKEQIQVALPVRKRLWQQIVKQKITAQIKTLETFSKDGKALKLLVKKVKTGDSENHEAQAAQKYWPLLMGKQFRRDTGADGINALLNYGYAILRAVVARAIVGSGLHPALGLHHHNQYNGLCLADDLMEPFRPWVDFQVCQLMAENDPVKIETETKTKLLALLSHPVEMQGLNMPMMVSCHYLTATLKRAFQDKTIKLDYPVLKMPET